jgi:hypothetical protein
MKRRISILVVALALVLSLAVGVIYARAAGSTDKPTMKVIVVFKSQAGSSAVMSKLTTHHSTGIYQYHLIPAVAATVSQSTVDALLKDPNVAGVYTDHKIAPPHDPTGSEGAARIGKAATADVTPLESEAVQLTHAQDAWNIEIKGQPVMGQGIRVGMTDTGTDPTHPDLAAAIEAYRDFTGSGLQDNDGHGTGTSSLVAAQGLPVYNIETGTAMRYSGMAPKAKILMAKVGDLNGGYDSQFIRGIQWLVDEKVDIISDSWGGFALPPDGNDPVSMAVKAAIQSGITYCVSAFNEGPGQGTLGSPSDLKDALTVGASTGNREFSQIQFLASPGAYKGDQVIGWSSRGPNAQGDYKPDIMAFGAYGWALDPMAGDAYGNAGIQEFGGTSMAAPVCAGDLALAECAWKLSHPGYKLPAPSYWKNLLASTATDLGYPALDQSSGMVNAAAAVKEVVHQGKSMLVSVAADKKNPTSWSPRLNGGANASTTISVKNTGNAKEKVSLTPTAFVVNKAQTITKDITLLEAQGYFDAEMITIPSGTQFVQAKVTWPSGPDVSIRTAFYDSDGNFLTYAPTYGGYGHLALTQVSLTGPVSQRPVVSAGQPWEFDIFPRGSMPPTDPTQVVHLRVKFFHKATWSAVNVSTSSVTLMPGATAKIKTTVKAPTAAGTSFGGLVVSNGATKTTVPVSIRVPVKIANGRGRFSGTITGSTVEYNGGEFYFYDFAVPSGTHSVSASLTWPDQGNLVNMYLVDPSGNVRDAKGGDLVAYPDYPYGLVPPSAFTHTAEQVVWDSPDAGKWQILVWAPGFSGDSFVEPYTGTITLNTGLVAQQSWTATAAPDATVGKDFTINNPGPTSLDAYAESQMIWNGMLQSEDVTLTPATGTLEAGMDSYLAAYSFDLPQNVSLLTCSATWTSDPSTLIDLSLYDPTATSKSTSLATTDMGNFAVVANPMAGTWTVALGYGNPALPAPTADYTLTVDYVAPYPIDGFASSADFDTPLTIAPSGGSGTIHASIHVPADAQPGDVIEGMIDFYTAASGVEVAGGDHLGSVPVTITVQ